MSENKIIPIDTSKRAAKFFDQRLEHAKAKAEKTGKGGRPSLSLAELQAGYRGFCKAMEAKEKKRSAKNTAG